MSIKINKRRQITVKNKETEMKKRVKDFTEKFLGTVKNAKLKKNYE